MDQYSIVPGSTRAPLHAKAASRLPGKDLELRRMNRQPAHHSSIARPRGGGPLPLLPDDPLLPLLQKASNEQLAPLVEILQQKGGLTSQLGTTASFRNHFPDHRAYVHDIAADIQKFGGNTMANQLWRGGKGVPYEQILHDVAKKLKIATSSRSVPEIERDILAGIMADAFSQMTPAEQRVMLASLKVKHATGLVGPGAAEALRVAIQHSGFAAYKSAVIVANASAQYILGHGLSLAANAALTQSIAVFAGPAGLAVAGLFACKGLAGPAYRVTVPFVLQVAAIRASLPVGEPTVWRKVIAFIEQNRLLLFPLLGLLLLAVWMAHSR